MSNELIVLICGFGLTIYHLYFLNGQLAKQIELLGRIEQLLYRQANPIHDD